MAEGKERRSVKERETLMYSTPEAAAEWRENVQEKVRLNTSVPVRREREVVAEAVAEEFSHEGYGVASLSQPWEHSPAEHTEAQELVDVAFATDLTTALKKAKQSPNWPRNLDLFHDVLTTEMYDLVKEHKLNEQPLLSWTFILVGLVLLALLVIGVLFAFVV